LEHDERAAGVADAAQLACLLEASAPKPGNVCPGRHFADTRYEDFLASAVAIGRPLADAGARTVGETVRSAIEATSRWTRSNTNLGIVLLLAPLARAALSALGDRGGRTPLASTDSLRRAVHQVLGSTTVEDSRHVFEAIRRAGPGGLGRADAEDVSNQPTQPLVDIMRLAAERDSIAREYVTGFQLTFEVGTPALVRARGEGLEWDAAIVETFLVLLAGTPDTHVARRAGATAAADVSRRAEAALAAGGVRTAEGQRAIDDMDRALRGEGNEHNPGTTADLTTAAIFVHLLAGGWSRM
jgi:triphosphoribosyl-dephospho-CoA synthase